MEEALRFAVQLCRKLISEKRSEFQCQFLPASCALHARPAGPKITLRFPRLYIYIYMCVHTCHVRNNYVTYIVAMQPYFSRLGQILDGCFA